VLFVQIVVTSSSNLIHKEVLQEITSKKRHRKEIAR
jgi:hypothetical protein